MENETPITKDIVENSYEFKIMKRIMKQEYPWITDVIYIGTPKDLEEYRSLLLIDIVVNADKFVKWCGGCETMWWMMYPPDGIKRVALASIFTISRELSSEIELNLKDIARKVRKSSALPPELKIPSGRTFAIVNYIVPYDKLTMPN